MSTERDEAESALARARTDLAKNCSYAVFWLHLLICTTGGYLMAAGWGEAHTACAFWRTVEEKCHDDDCPIRPWSCGPNRRSVVSEGIAKARARIGGPP